MKYIKDEEEILNIRRNLKKNKNFWFDIKQNRTQRQLLHLRKRRKKDNDDDKRKKKTKQKENTKDIYFLIVYNETVNHICLLYTSPSPRDATLSRMPSSA